jgi:F-type H+-transporting ATPase subunit b
MCLAAICLISLGMLSEEGGIPWWNYPGLEIWKFLNLLLFIVAGLYLLRRPLGDALRSRREGIQRDLVKAREERDTALARLAEVELRLEHLDSEVGALREKARAEAEAERERIRRGTEAELAKLRDQAQREIESAGKAARYELRRFAAEQSVKLAEEFVRRDIRAEDDARLIVLNVEELGRSTH